MLNEVCMLTGQAHTAIEEMRKRLPAGRPLESFIDAHEIERVCRAVGVAYKAPQGGPGAPGAQGGQGAPGGKRQAAPTQDDEVTGFAMNERVPDDD